MKCACRHEAPHTPACTAPACRCPKLRPLAPLPFQLGGWACIYADPPWPEEGGGGRGCQNHYDTMEPEEIAAMEVSTIVAHEAHLWLWLTNNFAEDGFKVARAWGFRPVTLITWPKKRQGLGHYAFGKTEHCLLAVRGDHSIRIGQTTTLLDPWEHPERKHSAKPPQMRERIERVTPGPRLELFARVAAPGWSAWGNQAPGAEVISIAGRACAWCGKPGELAPCDGAMACEVCRSTRARAGEAM